MSDDSERTFPRDIAALPEIFRFVAERLRALKAEEPGAFWADFVVEELFTNVVKYSPSARDVAVRIDRDADTLRIRVTDFDTEPFDVIGQAPVVDTTQPIEERTPGGLGLHLIRETSDAVEWEYTERRSIITVTKKLGA